MTTPTIRLWRDVAPGDELADGWTVVERSGRHVTLTGPTGERKGYPADDAVTRVVRRGQIGAVVDMFAAAGLEIIYEGSEAT